MTQAMTRVEVDTFPEPVLLSRSHKDEMAVKAILLECAGASSPRVEDQSEDTAFLCVIDIAGTKSLFGPPEMLVRNLLQRVRSLGISARVTVSSNFHAAVCLARGLSPSTPFRVIALGERDSGIVIPAVVCPQPHGDSGRDLRPGAFTRSACWLALPEKELIAAWGRK